MRRLILAISFVLTGGLAGCGGTEPVSHTESVSGIEAQKLAEKTIESGTTEISGEAYKESCQIFDYKEYFRNDQKYMGEKIQVDIQISQVIKGDCRGYDNSGNEYYISDMRPEDDKFRLIEDDLITVYGEYAGVGEITRAVGDYDEDIFCINARYIVLHDENGGLASDSDHGQVEIPKDGIPVDYIFTSNYGEEVSWHSNTTGFYMIPTMESENRKEPVDAYGIVEITWDSLDSIDHPSIRVAGNGQLADMSMIADDYSYWGSLEYDDASQNSEYIFPDSDRRLLTEADMAGLSAEELRIAKNEIYARRGRMFTSEDLKAYFESKSWYQGYLPAEQFNESVFNQVEKDNIVFIQKYIDNPSNITEDSGYASRGLAVNDPQAIPQIPGIYNYYSDPSDKNSMSMELHIEGGYAYVSFNEDGHQHRRSIDLYNVNDQEYVDESGTVGVYFDDYGKIATYNDSEGDTLNGVYTYLP